MMDDNNIFDESIITSTSNFDDIMRASLSDEMYHKLRVVGAFIMQGLEVDECAILALIEPAQMRELIEHNKGVAAFVRFKKTAYKAKLLRTMTSAAVDGKQEKIAGWLVEKKFDEYNDKKKNSDTRDDHILAQGLDFIRKNGDAVPLISEQADRS